MKRYRNYGAITREQVEGLSFNDLLVLEREFCGIMGPVNGVEIISMETRYMTKREIDRRKVEGYDPKPGVRPTTVLELGFADYGEQGDED